MLSVLNCSTTLTTFGNTKCAEVFCQTLDHFSIICTFCELKSFNFDDFLRHFRNVHFHNKATDKTKVKFEDESATCQELSDDGRTFREELQNVDQVTAEHVKDFMASKPESLKSPSWKEDSEIYDSNSDTNLNNDTDNSKNDENYVPKILTATKNRPTHQCSKCVNSYKILSNLERHIKKCHNEEKIYKCPRCDNVFESNRALSIHLQGTHAGFPCSKCDKTYKSKEALNHHMFKHSGQRNFVCAVESCGKSFYSPKSLSCHKRIVHAMERNYVCEICAYRTKSKSALVVHKRSHTGEKPYACNVCDRRFASQSLLAEHKAMHLTIRPHKCEVCGATFSRPKALYHHKHLHLGIKKFLCKICGKAYAQAAGLSGHMRHHKSEQFL